MMDPMVKRLAFAACALMLMSCTSSATAPDDWRLLPGVVDPSLSSVQAVVSPAQVTVGSQFEVTVHTLGSSSCTRANGTRVETREQEVRITPLDWIAPPQSVCTDDLKAFPHVVTLRLHRVGDAVLRIEARDFAGAAVQFDVPVRVVD